MVMNNTTPTIVSPVTIHKTEAGFFADDRNPGGRKIITDIHLKHRQAVRSVQSEVAKQMVPPHAHIDNIKGDRNRFG